jgi:hypothetical protein
MGPGSIPDEISYQIWDKFCRHMKKFTKRAGQSPGELTIPHNHREEPCCHFDKEFQRICQQLYSALVGYKAYVLPLDRLIDFAYIII